jgi:hypothetical protein
MFSALRLVESKCPSLDEILRIEAHKYPPRFVRYLLQQKSPSKISESMASRGGSIAYAAPTNDCDKIY